MREVCNNLPAHFKQFAILRNELYIHQEVPNNRTTRNGFGNFTDDIEPTSCKGSRSL
jgi:hypothetical protein